MVRLVCGTRENAVFSIHFTNYGTRYGIRFVPPWSAILSREGQLKRKNTRTLAVRVPVEILRAAKHSARIRFPQVNTDLVNRFISFVLILSVVECIECIIIVY